jgi:hypothetical protein
MGDGFACHNGGGQKVANKNITNVLLYLDMSVKSKLRITEVAYSVSTIFALFSCF